VAINFIPAGAELLTDYGNDYFQARNHCDFRIPGLDQVRPRTSLLTYYIPHPHPPHTCAI
jgi:hypothetical protein